MAPIRRALLLLNSAYECQPLNPLGLLHRIRPHVPCVQAASRAVQVSVHQASQGGCGYERAYRCLVRVQRETKGRGGKCVTVVKGLALEAAALAQLAKQLKAACGSGGTVKEGVIEVQGDHVEAVMAALQKQGHRVKRAGG
jgi:translation initiation factor 1